MTFNEFHEGDIVLPLICTSAAAGFLSFTSEASSSLSFSNLRSATSHTDEQGQYPWKQEVEEKMQAIFSTPRFRYHQRETIDETMAGNDGEPTCA